MSATSASRDSPNKPAICANKAMPLLSIDTNTPASDNTSGASTLSKAVAQMLGKPEQYVMVKLRTEQKLLFAGSDAPAAYVQLKSLGLPQDQTADYSATLCKLVASQFNIPKDRIYIEFSSPERHMWGWNGGTF